MNSFRSGLSEILSNCFQKSIAVKNLRNLSGGCINNALKVETSEGVFFIKYNHVSNPGLFEAEAKGLKLLKSKNVLTIPEVFCEGNFEDYIFLILEFIESASRKKAYWKELGYSLAELHLNSNSEFGLDHQNFIGSLSQSNTFHDDWISFFISERLIPQIKIGNHSGKISKSISQSFEKLFLKLPEVLLKDRPALLHGDLWNGNIMTDQNGSPALIDPAVYYGHREIEIAFTTLFGGFDDEFYEAYQEKNPMEEGYEERFEIYNLYPLLVHVNLFGGGYINSVKSVLKRFVG